SRLFAPSARRPASERRAWEGSSPSSAWTSTSVRWREECIEPADWLDRDERLDRALGLLSGDFALALATNNPRSVGEKSLDALGARSRFPVLVGLDDTLSSKPAPEPFRETARRLGLAPARCVSIGDRVDVDLSPAMEL